MKTTWSESFESVGNKPNKIMQSFTHAAIWWRWESVPKKQTWYSDPVGGIISRYRWKPTQWYAHTVHVYYPGKLLRLCDHEPVHIIYLRESIRQELIGSYCAVYVSSVPFCMLYSICVRVTRLRGRREGAVTLGQFCSRSGFGDRAI